MNGILVINKSQGYTSHDIVAIVKKIYKEKVGHTGTLDPNATGVLPLLIGDATKLSQYLINHDKEYEVVLELGTKTTTADSEGEVIERKDLDDKFLDERLNSENVNKVLESFKGKQEQIPPMYSAIKVNGKKLYEYARKGEKIELTPRKIEIYDIELIKINKEEKQIVFRVKCSKGTYIRSLCEDIANRLETIGYMKKLNRTVVGDFSIDQAITIQELEENKECINFLEEHIISVEDFFKKYKQEDIENNEIRLNCKEIKLLLNGVTLKHEENNGLYRIYDENNKFIGIGLVKNNILKREIIVENKKWIW